MSKIGEAWTNLVNLTPMGTPEKAELPTIDPKVADEIVRFNWQRIDPKVDLQSLPPMLQALLASATLVSDMSVKVLLTQKQAIAGDSGRQWAEESFQKTKASANTSQKWAAWGNGAAMILPLVAGGLVNQLKPAQDAARTVRAWFERHATPHASSLPWGDSIQDGITAMLNSIPLMDNGKFKSDTVQTIKNAAPQLGQGATQMGQIEQTKAQADAGLCQFNTQRTESEKQNASQTKSDLHQQVQAWHQFAQGLIESQHRTAEKVASAA